MILDAGELEPGALLQADICIVGAGAAGITLALQLADTHHQVILLESGGIAAVPATQALYNGECAPGSRHPPPVQYRRRQLGGSTTIWGGRCAPFDPIDFAARDWIPHSGWPIAYDTLRPFYARAAELCETGDDDFTADANWPQMLGGFSGDNFSADTIERFSCPTNFAARYGARLRQAKNLRVVLRANAVNLATSQEGDAVQSLHARTLDGRQFHLRARGFVLATGGLEIPRLLLACRDRHAAGIGNAHDQVGRYYMCHIAGTFGQLRAGTRVHHGYTVSPEGIYCRRRLALRPEAQRRLRTGNLVARLHHPRIADPAHRNPILSALYLAAPFITPEYATRLRDPALAGAAVTLRHARNIAAAPHNAAGFLLHWLRDRTLAARKFPSIIAPPQNATYTLDIHAEQQPNPNSRITLGTGTGTDALGQPPLRVDWRHLPADIDTVRTSLRALAHDLSRSGAATLDYDEDETEDAMLRDGAYGGHHIGTARMSDSPRYGVVDADCRVHGMRNLWLAGSAVFPTSSQANPTLTIVALAVRLGERIKQGLLF